MSNKLDETLINQSWGSAAYFYSDSSPHKQSFSDSALIDSDTIIYSKFFCYCSILHSDVTGR